MRLEFHHLVRLNALKREEGKRAELQNKFAILYRINDDTGGKRQPQHGEVLLPSDGQYRHVTATLRSGKRKYKRRAIVLWVQPG